jgi:hypothetical protein
MPCSFLHRVYPALVRDLPRQISSARAANHRDTYEK